MHLLIAMDTSLELLPSENNGGISVPNSTTSGRGSYSSLHSSGSVASEWHAALSEALRLKSLGVGEAETAAGATYSAGGSWATSIAGGAAYLSGSMRSKAHILLFNSTANRYSGNRHYWYLVYIYISKLFSHYYRLMRHSCADVRDAAEAMIR
jgi:hypothetical protein